MSSKTSSAGASFRTKPLTVSLTAELHDRITAWADAANTSSSRVFDALLREGLEYRSVYGSRNEAADRLNTAIARAEFLLGAAEIWERDNLSEAKIVAAMLADQPKARSYLDVLAPGAFDTEVLRATWLVYRRIANEDGRAAEVGDAGEPTDPIGRVGLLLAKPVVGKRERNRIMSRVEAELGLLRALGPAFAAEIDVCAHRVLAAAAKRAALGANRQTSPERAVPPETLTQLGIEAVQRGLQFKVPDLPEEEGAQ